LYHPPLHCQEKQSAGKKKTIIYLISPDEYNQSMNTHDRILAYLHENRAATVPGLSTLWGLTRPDIRHHIHNLIKEGSVEEVSSQAAQPARRGRREIAYRLCSSTGNSNYHNLCAALITLLLQGKTEMLQKEALEDLALILTGAPVSGDTLMQRLNNTVSWMRECGYHPRWEAAADGPRILFLHCPYASLVSDHPELCRLDQMVLAKLLGRGVAQTTKMDFNHSGSRVCTFISP
jgi:predicted ArsR family transcriptional regulator